MKTVSRKFSLVGSILLINLVLASPLLAATQIWNGTGAGFNNWSATGDWLSGNVPASGDDVKFFDTGGTTVSNINNVVDTGFAGYIGSLQYGNTNNNHTTLITNGVTLNITNTGGLTVGTLTDNGSAQIVDTTITGPGGTLNLSNSAANLLVDQGRAANGNGTQRAILDMSGLGTFVAKVNSISVGTTTVGGANNAQNATGTLLLALTNTITALTGTPITNGTSSTPTNSIEIGSDNGNAGGVDFLYLGQTNGFFIDSIGVGTMKATATMLFNSGLINPTAYFRGTNGSGSRVRFWTIGDMSSSGSSSANCSGTNDFTGGTVNALVDTMSLGRDRQGGNTGSSTTKGTLIFGAGTINVNNIFIGNQFFTAAANSNPMNGVVNVNGSGILQVNTNLTLGNTTVNSTAAQGTFGVLSVTNGTVYANNITVGAYTTSANNAINLTNATLIVTNTLATNASGLAAFRIANSVLGLNVPANGSLLGLVQTLTAFGATNVIQASVPVFSSYPQTIPLVQYTTLSGTFNFGLTNVPGAAPGAYLTNLATTPKSIALVLPTNPVPVITTQPQPFSGSPGATVTLTVTNTGVTPLSYQWYYTNGVSTNALSGSTGPGGSSAMTGSTSNILTLSGATTGDSGGYFAVITNLYGSATSTLVQVVIASSAIAPSVGGPTNLTVIVGNNATINDSVSGSPVPVLQWLDQTGTPIPSATTASLTLNNVQYSQNGYTYSLVASNSAGLATNITTLTVIVPPFITLQPTNVIVTNTQIASFTVAATGVPNPAYQWYKNNNPISSAANNTATNATFTIASASPGDTASYSCTITNLAGSTNSATVTLTVNSTMSATALTPANAATGVCYDTPLYVTFNATPVLQNSGTIKIYNVTNSTTPVDTINLGLNAANGTQTRSLFPGDSQTFNYYPVIITGTTAAIYPHSAVMTSNQTYYVMIDDGVFADTSGAYFAGIMATNVWQFTTKPTGPANPTNLIVAQDYSGDFATVQGAVDSLPLNNSNYALININNGNYVEIVDISGKSKVTFRGQSRAGTLVGYANNALIAPGGTTHARMAFKVNANNIAIENMTVTNRTPVGGSQAEALMIETGAARFILNNANVGSFQDTLLANVNSSQGYFYNSLIEGQFDYIWGGGNLFFTNCELRTLLGNNGSTTGGNLTAARTDNGATGNWPGYGGLLASNGFSFVNCQLTRVTNTITSTTLADSNGTTNGVVAWINCSFDANYILPAVGVLNSQLLWEYGNSNLTDTAAITFGLAVGESAPALTSGDPRLLAAQNSTTWLNGWVPQLAPNITSQPGNQAVSHGQSANFAVSATGIPSPTYQWLQNSSPIFGATGTNYTIASAVRTNGGAYSVVVSNSSGSVTSQVATLTYLDTAPVAGSSFTMGVLTGIPTTVQIVGGKYPPTDVDGDALTIISVTGYTNATVTTDGTNITYTATNGTVDSFTYTVSDGYGGTASQTIGVTISSSQGYNLLSSQVIGGNIVLMYLGIPGFDYALDWTHSLTPPVIWQPLFTNAAAMNGAINFTNMPSGGMDFYRTRYVP